MRFSEEAYQLLVTNTKQFIHLNTGESITLSVSFNLETWGKANLLYEGVDFPYPHYADASPPRNLSANVNVL